MYDNPFMHVIFRLANIGLLVAFFGFLFKKYGISMLQDGVEAFHAHMTRLQTQLRKNKEKKSTLITAYKEREHLFETIKNRLERWHLYASRVSEQRIKDNIAHQSALNFKHERKVHARMLAAMQKENTEQILSSARAVLIERYRHQEEGRRFIEQLINTLPKSSQ